MKILFIIDSLGSGGKERRLVSLIEGLHGFGNVEMELITLSKEIHYKGILDMPVKIHYLKRDIRKDFKIILKFKKILNNFKPDLVHGWDNLAAIHFAPICKLKRIPFINSMITAAPNINRFSKRYLINAISYSFSDVILSNSQAGLDHLFVPEKKQKVIYNGFNFNRLKNLKKEKIIYKKFGIEEDKFIIGMVASFSNHKDYGTFVKAGKILTGKRNDVVFVAVGDGSNLISIKTRIKRENLKNFYFLGRQNDVESIVNIFDIGILLSNTVIHGEGISNAIMEYMALAKPVIATDGGGTKELVSQNETGFLIKEKDVGLLVKKIEVLLDDLEFSKEMGDNGKKRIEDFFSIEKMVNETYQLYLKTIN